MERGYKRRILIGNLSAPVERVIGRAYDCKVETYYHANLSHKIWNFIIHTPSKNIIMRPAAVMKRLINFCLVVYLALSPHDVGLAVSIHTQQSYPDVPGDLTKVYYVAAENKLAPLPYEKGVTSVNAYAVAQADRTSEVKLDGPKAATLLNDSTPSFYVFIADEMDPPPHLLIRLTSKKASRHFTVTRTKGRKGYAPLDEENVRLDYRILERLPVEAGEGRIIFVNYMEIHPRQPLAPGEYAVIGDSLSDIATFTVK